MQDYYEKLVDNMFCENGKLTDEGRRCMVEYVKEFEKQEEIISDLESRVYGLEDKLRDIGFTLSP